jgi:hypothetical protein
MSDIFKVTYYVRDTCSIEVEAESQEEATAKVLQNNFEEDETYDFINAEITEVIDVEKLT